MTERRQSKSTLQTNRDNTERLRNEIEQETIAIGKRVRVLDRHAGEDNPFRKYKLIEKRLKRLETLEQALRQSVTASRRGLSYQRAK